MDRPLIQSLNLLIPIQGFTLLVLSDFAKKNNFHNNSLISVSCNALTYPAKLFISNSKKIKQKFLLLNNGCIPPGISSISKFSVSPTYHWLFAKSITLTPISMVKFTCDSTDSKYTENLIPADLSNFDNTENLQKFLKKELIKQSICFKKGMKLHVQYSSHNFIFHINDLVGCFYEFPNICQVEPGYKCFNETLIQLLENKIVTSTETERLNEREYFGGYESQLKELLSVVDNLIMNLSTKTTGILISGPSGCGKSMIGDILQSSYKNNCIAIRSDDLASSFIGEGEALLKKIFKNLKARAPAFLFIDDIDDLCSDRDLGGHSGIVNSLLHLMDGVMVGNMMDTMVICTATQPKNLDTALRRPGRLCHDIVLSIPTELERYSILKKIFGRSQAELIDDCTISLLASKTPGFSGGDLMRIVSETYSHFDNPGVGHFLELLKNFKPSSLKNVAAARVEVHWNDIYGYHEFKEGMADAFKLTLSHKELFIECQITPPSRFLLFGPSGCGKTLLTHALAHLYNLTIIPIRRSNVLGKYFGESEKNLATLFEKAQNSAPCIIHFENFDGLACRKSADAETSSDVEGRIINHLKVLLDGVVGYENVFVVAETNRPDLLDKDVIRHGRFHRYFYVSLPNDKERETMICAKLQLEIGSPLTVLLSHETRGFTMAEIKLFIFELKKKIESNSLNKNLHCLVEDDFSDFLEEICAKASPNTSSRMIKKFEEFNSVYCAKIK